MGTLALMRLVESWMQGVYTAQHGYDEQATQSGMLHTLGAISTLEFIATTQQ
jgi:hypothetical protein